MNYLRLLLLPFSLVYGWATYVRNRLYDLNIFSVTSFSVPIIAVGNLTTGGTGKTPHVNYLVQLLSPTKNLAVLSRGYRRSSKGFVIATPVSTSFEIGDEPKQYKTKFPNSTVAVCESRVEGVNSILRIYPQTELILLDDAFQHRSIKPGYSILLIDYQDILSRNYVIPAGSLREFSTGSKRADILIITKTPSSFSAIKMEQVHQKIKPLPHQKMYFSYIRYGQAVPLRKEGSSVLDMNAGSKRDYHFLVLTGIASPEPFWDSLKTYSNNLHTARFPDHHNFTRQEIIDLKNRFDKIDSPHKIMLTTEKDAMRLYASGADLLRDIPVYYIPIEIAFHANGQAEFDQQILKI